jgi:hypothetical protein
VVPAAPVVLAAVVPPLLVVPLLELEDDDAPELELA